MSRVGKKPIGIPDKVTVTVNGQNVKVAGPKGKLDFTAHKAAAIAVEARPLIEGLDPMSAAIANTLVADIKEYGGLGQRVVSQSRRRVIDGEQVPVEEKLFSILIIFFNIFINQFKLHFFSRIWKKCSI